MSESEKPFTVKDRRHFTPDGDVREVPEATEAEPPAESPPPSRDHSAPEEPSPASDSPPAPDSPEDGSPEPPPAAAEPPREAPGGEGEGPPYGAPGGPVDLGQFLFSLGAQASMLLTGQGLPEGAEPAEALAGARSIISILEMLEKKTEGNRTPEESQVLEGLLYELRMAYLEKSRGAGS